MIALKIEESCSENKQWVSASGASISERNCGFFTISSDSSSTVNSSQSHRRNTGPIRRVKGGWTPEKDETLRRAVELYEGRNWKKIAESVHGRTEVQCLHRWKKVINPEVVKGSWTPLEDCIIINLVAEYGPTKWSIIAKSLPGRIGKQCRERWHNHLNPEIRKDTWTLEEELELMKAHIKHGNKWAEIAKVVPGRAHNSIKNHWNCSLKKKLDYYLRTGELPPIQEIPMPDIAEDTGNLCTNQLIYCSNSGLETEIKNHESSRLANQHDSVPKYASLNASVRESGSSDTGECNVQVSETVVQDTSDSGEKLEVENSDREFSQNEQLCGTTVSSFPSDIHFLCYKPPQLEDLVISGLSSPFYNCSGKQIVESFQKTAATSFLNTPSIIKRRREAYAPPESNEGRMHEGCAPNVSNTEGFRFSMFLSSPCSSSRDFFNNEEDFIDIKDEEEDSFQICKFSLPQRF